MPNLFLNLFRRVAPQFWETVTFANQPERARYYAVRSQWTENEQLFEQFGKTGIQRCEQNLLRIRDLAEAHGASFRIVLYPWPIQIRSKKYPSIYETAFGDFAKNEHIHALNLSPLFRTDPNWRRYFLHGDVHWSEEGNLLVAKTLLKDFEDD